MAKANEALPIPPETIYAVLAGITFGVLIGIALRELSEGKEKEEAYQFMYRIGYLVGSAPKSKGGDDGK